MFCDSCGTSVEPGQMFCNKCGKQFAAPMPFVQQRPSRVQGHIHLLGVLWLAMSAMNAVAGIVLCILGNTLFPHLHEMGAPPQVPTGFLGTLVCTIGIAILAKAAFGFLAGWGLLRCESWARILALVLAFIALFHIPFGTALGVYTLWVLMPGQSQQEYDVLVTARAV